MIKINKITPLILTTLFLSACADSSTEETKPSGLAEHLEICKEYTEEFKHPFTQETLQRGIEGLVNGKCIYVENMPNNGVMRCEYNESTRIEAANYYKSIVPTSKHSIKTSTKLSSGESNLNNSGTKLKNPLSEAMASGICQISGY